MQIKLYKRGGAACGRKKRERGGQGLSPAVQLRALGAPAALRAVQTMASPLAPRRDRAGRENKDRWEARGDRKVRAGPRGGLGRGPALRRSSVSRFPQARKPLVEKKRRARINESLRELRQLLAGPEVRLAGRCPGAAERAGGRGPGTASPHLPSPPGAPAGAGAGQAGERRGAGADGAARAGSAAGQGSR